jgi:hypothetical protein
MVHVVDLTFTASWFSYVNEARTFLYSREAAREKKIYITLGDILD